MLITSNSFLPSSESGVLVIYPPPPPLSESLDDRTTRCVADTVDLACIT